MLRDKFACLLANLSAFLHQAKNKKTNNNNSKIYRTMIDVYVQIIQQRGKLCADKGIVKIADVAKFFNHNVES